MKLDPGFISHWKTERLISELGADGVVAVLRLWGNAQIKRKYSGLQFTPRRLALETRWTGDEDRLFSVLTDPDAPWLDLAEDGTYSIHGFSHHQKNVIALWENGKRGGRPAKEKEISPEPSKENNTLTLTHTLNLIGSETEPNGFVPKPTENHLVFAGAELISEESAIAQCFNAGIPSDFASYVYADWSTRDGKDASGVRCQFVRLAKKRWNREQTEWISGTHKGKGGRGHRKTEADRDRENTGLDEGLKLKRL